MKAYLFMITVILFLVSCGDYPNITDNSTNNGNNNNGGFNGNGTYGTPVLLGDIKEKPATSILIKQNDEVVDNPTFNLDKVNNSISFSSLMQPVAVKDASIFNVVSTQSDGFAMQTTCHTGLYNNNCFTTYTFMPYCNGIVKSLMKLQADKSSFVNVNIIGKGESFSKECSNNFDNNTVLSIDKSSHRFKNINETIFFTVKSNKPINNHFRYSANGAINGFYYSYACFYNDNNCYGFIQFTGKVGKYDCMGETDYKLVINPNIDSSEIKASEILVYGFGLGKNKDYTCKNNT